MSHASVLSARTESARGRDIRFVECGIPEQPLQDGQRREYISGPLCFSYSVCYPLLQNILNCINNVHYIKCVLAVINGTRNHKMSLVLLAADSFSNEFITEIRQAAQENGVEYVYMPSETGSKMFRNLMSRNNRNCKTTQI